MTETASIGVMPIAIPKVNPNDTATIKMAPRGYLLHCLFSPGWSSIRLKNKAAVNTNAIIAKYDIGTVTYL